MAYLGQVAFRARRRGSAPSKNPENEVEPEQKGVPATEIGAPSPDSIRGISSEILRVKSSKKVSEAGYRAP